MTVALSKLRDFEEWARAVLGDGTRTLQGMPGDAATRTKDEEAARRAAKRELDRVGENLPKRALGRGDGDARPEPEGRSGDEEPH